MEYQWYDFIGNAGVFMILLAYLLSQLNKIDNQSIKFSLLNASGAFSVLVSLYFKFNLSAFTIELFWLLISIVGIVKSLKNQTSKEGRKVWEEWRNRLHAKMHELK